MEGFEARLSGYCASSRQFVLFEYVSTGVLAGIGTINLVLGRSTPEIQSLEMRPGGMTIRAIPARHGRDRAG